jgi:hypothetical protein
VGLGTLFEVEDDALEHLFFFVIVAIFSFAGGMAGILESKRLVWQSGQTSLLEAGAS